MVFGLFLQYFKDVAIFYPLRIIMSILGVPKKDETRMLRLTQELFGGGDEDMIRDVEESSLNQIQLLIFLNILRLF